MMRKTTIILAAKLVIITAIAHGQSPYLPEDLKGFYEQEKIKSLFELNTVMNPFYLRGDFDGDKKADYVFAVTERKTGKGGMIIYHPTLKNYFVIGAGVEVSNRPGDDYGWMNAWEVFCKKEVEKGVGEAGTIKLKGDAILVLKLESSSGLIYWDGKKYQWCQQGD
ncbi:MAG: hypothetical protein ACKO96_25640 [Flammeovirgaceae bacterium]